MAPCEFERLATLVVVTLQLRAADEVHALDDELARVPILAGG